MTIKFIKPMKRTSALILVFFCFFLFQSIFAQNVNETIKGQAEKMAQALIDGDYGILIDYTHPNVIAFSGGKDKMMGYLNSQMSKMAEEGIIYEAVEIGEPLETKLHGGQYQTLVPKTTTINRNGQRVLSKDFLFGFSDSEGQNWTFVEAATLKTAAAQRIFPDFQTEIEIPDRKAPVELESDGEATTIDNSETLEDAVTTEEPAHSNDQQQENVENDGFPTYILGLLLLVLIAVIVFFALRAKKNKTLATSSSVGESTTKKIEKVECTQCGQTNSTDSKFCTYCGHEL